MLSTYTFFFTSFQYFSVCSHHEGHTFEIRQVDSYSRPRHCVYKSESEYTMGRFQHAHVVCVPEGVEAKDRYPEIPYPEIPYPGILSRSGCYCWTGSKLNQPDPPWVLMLDGFKTNLT